MLIETLLRARITLMDMFALQDEQQRKVMERLGLEKRDVYEKFPPELTKLYNKYGNEDDPSDTFGEDELPVDTSTPEDEPDDEQDDDEQEDV